MDGTKTTTNWIIAGLVALVVIIGGGWLIARERSGTMAGANATSTESTSTGIASSENPSPTPASPTTKPSTKYVASPTTSSSGETLSVSDQPAGLSVKVDNVNITKPTWVAVRDSRPWYLGWKLVKASGDNISVPLQRNTVSGESYEVVLFVDNGDGTFAIHGGDSLVADTSGAPVSSTFKVQ